MALQPDDPVPAVTATTQDGDRPTVEFVGPTVLLFFGSTDAPSGVAAVAGFDDRLDAYHDAGVDVYATSTADVDAHRRLAADRSLDMPLLADPDAKVARAFGLPPGGTVAEPGGNGDRTGAVTPTTFVCARRQVCGLYEGFVADHARSVLRDLVEFGLVAPPAVEQPTG